MRSYTIKVKTPSREIRVVDLGNNELKIWLTKPRQRGKANRQLIEVLAEHFDVQKSKIMMVRGDTMEIKNIVILD